MHFGERVAEFETVIPCRDESGVESGERVSGILYLQTPTVHEEIAVEAGAESVGSFRVTEGC